MWCLLECVWLTGRRLAYRAVVMTARTLKPSASRLAVSRSASSRVGTTIGYPQGTFLARHASRTSCTSASTLGALGPSSPADAARSVGPQEDHANPRHVENLIEMLDPGQRFDLKHCDELPGRIERPEIARRLRESHRADGGHGLCPCLDVGEHHTQRTRVEHLLDHRLGRVSRRERNTHDWRDGGRTVARPYRDHSLANPVDIEIAVLFVDDREVEVAS